MAIVAFLHISLRVSDLERSCRFYGDALGCEIGPVRDFEGPATAAPLLHEGARARAATVDRDGVAIELVELDAPRPDVAPDLGRSPVRLVFAVDDLASSLQSLRDRGVDVIEESRMCFAQGVASCLVRDPDGLLIQLYQEPAGVGLP